MNKLFLLVVLSFCAVVVSGCQSEKNAGLSEEDMRQRRLHSGEGVYMNIVNDYTMPATEADVVAKPSDILTTPDGKPYRVIKHHK